MMTEFGLDVIPPVSSCLLLPVSFPSEELHHAAGRGPAGLQLSAAPGGRGRPGADHPGPPADGSGAEAAQGRALLPAGQTDLQSAPAWRSWESVQLEDPDLHVLHLHPHQGHPAIPQVPPEEVRG